jgi:hypothetical protein
MTSGCIVGPGNGRINARATLEPSERKCESTWQGRRNCKTFSARLVADKFPAWEFIRYPRYIQFPPLWEGWVIGVRDQTELGDLKSGVQSTCVSVGPEKLDKGGPDDFRPMSC